jgi:hypothetical protein
MAMASFFMPTLEYHNAFMTELLESWDDVFGHCYVVDPDNPVPEAHADVPAPEQDAAFPAPARDTESPMADAPVAAPPPAPNFLPIKGLLRERPTSTMLHAWWEDLSLKREISPNAASLIWREYMVNSCPDSLKAKVIWPSEKLRQMWQEYQQNVLPPKEDQGWRFASVMLLALPVTAASVDAIVTELAYPRLPGLSIPKEPYDPMQVLTMFDA